jgi:ABC-type transport system involved in multi-copper enzyme maturation permease subunit
LSFALQAVLFYRKYEGIYPGAEHEELTMLLGALIIKVSFVSLLISFTLVSREMDSSSPGKLFRNVYRAEVLTLFLVAFLCCGVFVFFSSAGTLLLLSTSVFSFFWNRKALREFTA